MNRRAIGMALVGAQFVLLAGIVLLPWTAPFWDRMPLALVIGGALRHLDAP